MLNNQCLTIVKAQNTQKIKQQYQNDQPFFIKRDKNAKKVFSKKGDWNFDEIIEYVVFLENNIQQMLGKCHYQLWNTYKAMSKFIKTRNYRQCKNYHQKQCLKFQTIFEIINNIITTMQQFNFKQKIKQKRQYFQNYKQQQQKVTKQLNKKAKDQIKTDIMYEKVQNNPKEINQIKDTFKHVQPIKSIFWNQIYSQPYIQYLKKIQLQNCLFFPYSLFWYKFIQN